MHTKECDVLIIGGGVAGLMAGIELSQNGKKVIILEKSLKLEDNVKLKF